MKAKHIVTRLVREGENRAYGYRCTCGGHWKIYQKPHHVPDSPMQELLAACDKLRGGMPFSVEPVSLNNESLPEGCEIIADGKSYFWRHWDGLEGWPFLKQQDAIDSAWKRWGAEHDAIKLAREMENEPNA
jgi:hypothetical protein